MTYHKPQILNVKKASLAIMGGKHSINMDSTRPSSSNSAYQSDE